MKRRRCQLKRPWYAARVGGAAARVGESVVHSKVGVALKKMGQTASAREEFVAGRMIMATLVEQNPGLAECLLGSTINLPVRVDSAGFLFTDAGGRADLGIGGKQP